MKLLVVSDIHGSGYYANKIKEIYEKENPDKLILLGDLYYHGPRNPLTEQYNPGEVSNILNSLKDNIKCIKGNCDAEVDEMISEFPLEDHIIIEINNKKIFFTHGHKYNIDKLPEEDFDILVYGHFHTGFIKEKDGKLFINSGSITLPKDNTEHSYLIIDENKITLKNVDGEIIEQTDLKF